MNAPHLTWSWQISFGHVASFAGAVFVGALAWAEVRHSDEAQTRRLDVLEASVGRAAERLSAADIAAARADARMERIEELMTEVREALRALNRKDEK